MVGLGFKAGQTTAIGVISTSRTIINIDRNSERRWVDVIRRTGEKKRESNDIDSLSMGDLKPEVEPPINPAKTGARPQSQSEAATRGDKSRALPTYDVDNVGR